MSADACQLSSSDLMSVLNTRKGELMAIIASYWDESGKFEDQEIVAFCGFCLSASNVKRFEDKWRELLRRNDLSALKAHTALSERRALSSKIPAQTVEERIEVLKPFADCITEGFELGVAIAVKVEAFRRTAQHIKKKIAGGEDPFYFAFMLAITSLLNYRKSDEKMAVLFDDDEKTAKHCLTLYRKMKLENAQYRKALTSITFAEDETYLGLQAADLLSSLTRLHSDFELSGTPYRYEPLLRYLAEDRGTRSIQWKRGCIGEQKMAKIELGWKWHEKTD